MIIKKLGLFVLWCICIILGLKALTHAFSETVGIVIIVCVVVVADIVQRYFNRHERWFRKRVNMLRTICPNSPNDFRMIGDPLFESFSLGNFFIQYKPETKEFHLCCCIYMVLPNIVETWNKAIEGRTRQTLWRAVQMLTQKLCCQTIHDCPKVVPLHYESEWQ